EVDDPRLRIDDHVLEDRAEPTARRVDQRLALGGEADHLRVVPALEVEDALVRPAVLVVADELARRVGREGRLAGAREAEEERDVAILTDVSRAVHREDAT